MSLALNTLHSGNGKLINGQAIGAASFTSKAIDVSWAQELGLEFYSASADRAGTLTVELSVSGDRWTSADFSDGTNSIAVTGSAELKTYKSLPLNGARYARVVYTRSDGTTGSLDTFFLRKKAR